MGSVIDATIAPRTEGNTCRFYRKAGNACSLLADHILYRLDKHIRKMDHISSGSVKEIEIEGEHPLYTFSINNKRDDISYEVRVQMYDEEYIKVSLDKVRGSTESIYLKYEGDSKEFVISDYDKIEEFAIISSAMSTGGM